MRYIIVLLVLVVYTYYTLAILIILLFATMFIKLGICTFAGIPPILVWFVSVVTVDTVVRLHAIVTVPVGVTLISAKLPRIAGRKSSLATNSYTASIRLL